MIREELRRQVLEAAKKAGVAKATAEMVLAHAAECAYATAAIKRLPRDDKPGASRIGGLPDLPKDVEWPAATGEVGKKGRSHAQFVAQFNLSEVPELEGLALQRTGYMWVFMRDVLEDLAVMYEAAPAALKRRASPMKRGTPGSRPLNAVPLRFKRGVSLPYFSARFQGVLAEAKEAGRGDADSLVGALMREDFEAQVGGYAQIPDHDMFRVIAFRELGKPDYVYADNWASLEEFEKQLGGGASASFLGGAVCESYRKMKPAVEWIDKNRAKIEAEAGKWRTLFCFERSMKSGLELGDGMGLGVFVRAADLEAGRFDRVVGECPMVL